MNHEFDPEFEGQRLNQLVNQLISSDEITGNIVFGCIGEDSTGIHSTWFFEKNIYATLKESGFKDMLISLLDVLIRYRTSFNMQHANEGVIKLHNSTATLTWLKNGEAEPLIDKMKLKK